MIDRPTIGMLATRTCDRHFRLWVLLPCPSDHDGTPGDGSLCAYTGYWNPIANPWDPHCYGKALEGPFDDFSAVAHIGYLPLDVLKAFMD